MFYYSLIGLACNYMFLQDLSLLINRKKIILFILSNILPPVNYYNISNPQLATRNSQPATRNSQPATRNPQLATRNPQPATRNPQPVTRTS